MKSQTIAALSSIAISLTANAAIPPYSVSANSDSNSGKQLDRSALNLEKLNVHRLNALEKEAKVYAGGTTRCCGSGTCENICGIFSVVSTEEDGLIQCPY